MGSSLQVYGVVEVRGRGKTACRDFVSSAGQADSGKTPEYELRAQMRARMMSACLHCARAAVAADSNTTGRSGVGVWVGESLKAGFQSDDGLHWGDRR